MDKEQIVNAANFVRMQAHVYENCVKSAERIARQRAYGTIEVQGVAAHIFETYCTACRDNADREFEISILEREKKSKRKRRTTVKR